MANPCSIPSNVSDYTDYDTDIAPMWIQVGVVVVGVATVLVNIPAIIAVIFTKLRNPKSRNLHLLILGLTDLLVGLSLFPILITFVDPNSKISHTSCFFRMYSFALIYFNSLGQVCVICIDRTFLLARPSWRCTSEYVRRYFWMLGTMFLFLFLSLSLTFFILGFPKNHIVTCKLESIFCDKFNFFSTAFGVISTCIECVIVICCVTMVMVIQRHGRNFKVGPTSNNKTATKRVSNGKIHRPREDLNQTNQQSNSEKESRVNRMRSRSTFTIIIIIINFFICVTPLNLGSIMQGFRVLKRTTRTTRHATLILTTVNSLINPFIYCFRTPDIRVTMRNGISKCRSLFKC